MKKFIIQILAVMLVNPAFSQGENEDSSFAGSQDLVIDNASVVYDDELEQLVFSINVKGKAGASIPKAAGQLDGAPVLGHYKRK